MSLPVVAIIGRPNVGKSSLLNCLARERISIVDPRAGITRDRVSAIIEHDELYFELVDTGGVGIVDDDQLESHVEQQIQYAVAAASLILVVVDVLGGQTALDQRVVEMVRPLNKPVIVVANKVDDVRHQPEAAELHGMGLGEPALVSALHARGREELLDRVVATLRTLPGVGVAPAEPVMKLAIVGKRNAGKSTLVNALAGEARVIVSEIPGTTRDAVDVRFERDGRTFIAIDTAGVRKRRSMDDIDFYSYNRALRSIQRADVVMHLIDATVPVSEVDLKLARAVVDELKPLVLAVNKWDLVGTKATSGDYADYLTRVITFVRYAPLTFITAQTGKNVDAAVDVAVSLFRQAQLRVSTARLNAALESILAIQGPAPKRGSKFLKIYYATQISVAPPTIVFFCNEPTLVTESYRRFMENKLREMLPFAEVPLRFLFRARQRASLADSGGASR